MSMSDRHDRHDTSTCHVTCQRVMSHVKVSCDISTSHVTVWNGACDTLCRHPLPTPPHAHPTPLCNALHHTTPHCTAPHHTAPHCSTLRHTAAHCSTLQHTVAHYSTLQHIAAHCNTLQHTATHCSTLQHAAPRCTTLQHTRAEWSRRNTVWQGV